MAAPQQTQFCPPAVPVRLELLPSFLQILIDQILKNLGSIVTVKDYVFVNTDDFPSLGSPSEFGVYIKDGRIFVVNSGTGPDALTLIETGNVVLGPKLRSYNTRGTDASPSAILDNDQLGEVSFGGYDGSGLTDAIILKTYAGENWGGSNKGAEFALYVIKNGATATNSQAAVHTDGSSCWYLTRRRMLFGQQNISADTNDMALNISGEVLRCTPSGSYTITGFVAPALSIAGEGTSFWLLNSSTSNTLSLANESSSSSAANRIITGTGGTVVLNPNQSKRLWYDTTSTRWRILG